MKTISSATTMLRMIMMRMIMMISLHFFLIASCHVVGKHSFIISFFFFFEIHDLIIIFIFHLQHHLYLDLPHFLQLMLLLHLLPPRHRLLYQHHHRPLQVPYLYHHAPLQVLNRHPLHPLKCLPIYYFSSSYIFFASSS